MLQSEVAKRNVHQERYSRICIFPYELSYCHGAAHPRLTIPTPKATSSLQQLSLSPKCGGVLPCAMLHETARPYLHVTKVSYGFAKIADLSCGILDPEAGSHSDTVLTSGIAGPEFKTYRIIMYSAGLVSNPARESKWNTFCVKILRGVRGELGCSSQKL